MQYADTSHLRVLRRFWLIGVAAAVLVGPTPAIAAQPDSHGLDKKSTSQKHDKADGHSEKGSDQTKKEDKADGHPDKGSDHAKKGDKADGHPDKGSDHGKKGDKADGHSKKGSDGASILNVIKKAAKEQSDSQNAP